jgi:nitrogen fixation/metabolism regulation signal transduction histidine kinase
MVLLVLLSTAGLAAQSALARALDRVIGQDVAVALAAEKMARALDQGQAAVEAIVSGHGLQRPRNRVTASRQQFCHAKKRADDSMGAASDRERGLLVQIERERVRYDGIVDRILAARDAPPEAVAYGDTQVAYETIERLIRDLSEASNERNAQTVLEAQQIAWRTRVWISIVCALALGATIWLAMHMHNRIIEPLSRMARSAQAVGEGNTQVRLQYRERDELGELAQRVNALLDDAERRRRNVAQRAMQVDQLIEAWLEQHEPPLAIAMETGQISWANSRFSNAMDSAQQQAGAPRSLASLAAHYEVERSPITYRGGREVGWLIRLRHRSAV